MAWTLRNMVATLKRKRLRRDIARVLERMLDGDEPEKHVDSFASEIVALLEADA
jgi:hypothetical protein